MGVNIHGNKGAITGAGLWSLSLVTIRETTGFPEQPLAPWSLQTGTKASKIREQVSQLYTKALLFTPNGRHLVTPCALFHDPGVSLETVKIQGQTL